ncbi:iron complex outermembrane receptor protein [Sphingomonas vulcanisoli]|uniref:Iron complex outermembrane receptor protein n=1 Tax=Sphingomonas vulcanisoli TaxID=1658060 RepID=A0ABX0TVN8_9SPHN|nr:TonB-dependent receptor [Sphingomonas vulcanisoli]NIJ08510.1 iron complex outermembrane receptor protein [Sphingomonas vulcanisoli]
MTISVRRSHARSTAPALALVFALASQAAHATDADPAPEPAPPAANNGIAEGSDIVVTGTKANAIAPVTASLRETQPASIVSRSFIEDSLPASADFNNVALISPSVANSGGENGVGLNESKTTIRGFQDGEYNITYDGVPFGDTNGPTHHSNTFFPSNTIETLVIDRGPGNASQLGESTYGGNMNLFSRETRADPSAEFKGAYGSFNTYLFRGLLQSGAIDKLGGTEAVVSAQYIKTDGRLSLSGYNQKNIFGKVVIPIGSSVHLSLLSTYNKNHFNQPDKNGVTLAQQALYGKYYNLNNDPTSQSYIDYNATTKTTDFEIAKLDGEIAPGFTFVNTAYTFYYDNETLSGNAATTLPTGVLSTTNANTTVTLADGTKTTGVPGYTKTNKYRVWGTIPKTRYDFGFGALTAGLWIERADTFRQQTDVNLVTGDFNYVEKKVTNPSTGAVTPLYVKFNQNSGFNHTEGFGELELRPVSGLTITPGFKYVNFNIFIHAAYNQTTRYAQNISKTYTKSLPFLTANYAISSQMSVYGQFAKGMSVPILGDLYVNNPSLSSIQPQTSTNYQTGFVYHGERLSFDADVYYIKINNKIQQETVIDNTGASQTAFFNAGRVLYKGIEGQVTYALPAGFAVFANGSLNYAKEAGTHNPVSNAPKGTAAGGLLYKHGPIRFSLIDKWTGPQYATNESLDPTQTFFVLARSVRISPYNDAILAMSYEWHNLRVGLNVTDLFNSRRIENIGLSGAGPAGNTFRGLNQTTDQLYYQPGRQVTGDITVKF